jgi:hypothetical protein
MTRELPSGKIIVRLAPQQSRYDDSPVDKKARAANMYLYPPDLSWGKAVMRSFAAA